MSFSNPYVDVEAHNVSVGGKEVKKVGIMVRNDDGDFECSGVLSADYQLIKNSIARDVVSNIQARSNMKWKSLKVMWDGKKYCHYYHTESPITSIKANGQAHDIVLGMMNRNSYDGSWCWGLEFYLMNMVCTNQYVSRNQFGYYNIRHVGADDYDIQDALQNVSISSERALAVAPKIEALTALPATLATIIKARKETNMPTSKWGEVIEALEGSTMFSLYQAMTYVSSHSLTGFSSVNVGASITDWALA